MLSDSFSISDPNNEFAEPNEPSKHLKKQEQSNSKKKIFRIDTNQCLFSVCQSQQEASLVLDQIKTF
jgi:hypothetical protein